MLVLNKVREDMDKLTCEPRLRMDAIAELERILLLSESERKSIIEQKLIDQIWYAARNSKFYSKLFESNGICISEIKTAKDLIKLPFTTKDDLREQYPLGILATDISEVSRYAESTGTTGRPTSSYFSRTDWFENNIFASYRLMDIFSSKDIAVIAAPYELSVPAQDLERIFELIGTTVIACGVLNEVCSWDRLINIIKYAQPTAMVCSGTRALLMAEMAKSMGYDPAKDFSVRKILNIGETANAIKAKKIKELWNAEIYNAYGMTETCALGITCGHGNMHLFNERYFYEVIDPTTCQPLPFGEKGELVITPLANKAMPLIRYRTGDLVCIREIDCKCGNKSPVLEHFGRMGENVELDGFQISFLKLEEVIMKCPGQDKLYLVTYSKDEVNITLDIKEGYSFDELKNDMLGSFPEFVRNKIHISTFGKKEREDYFTFLKGSLKPFAKMFVSK